MNNFIDFDEDFEEIEEIDPNTALENIQLKSLAESVLKDIQITKVKHYRKDIKKIAKEYIKIFFKNKKNIKNEKLKKEILCSRSNIEKLVNLNIVESTKIIYSALDKNKKYGIKNKKEDVTNEIKLVNESLKKIYKAKIPQQFAGGILLIYLELCKDINVN